MVLSTLDIKYIIKIATLIKKINLEDQAAFFFHYVYKNIIKSLAFTCDLYRTRLHAM